MLIMSQDKRRFVITGPGMCIGAYKEKPDKDGVNISAWRGTDETEVSLGRYSDYIVAEFVISEIFDFIASGKEKYIMPSNEMAEPEASLRAEAMNRKKMSHKTDTLQDLNISIRTYNALKRAGFRDPEDVKAATEKQLRRVRGIGDAGVEELRRLGLILEDSPNA